MQKIAGTLLMVVTGFFLDNSLLNDSNTNPAVRKTIETISGQPGIIRKIGTEETAVYMIDCRAKNVRLHVYNMPAEYKKDGLQVKFSGNIKASSTLEDDFGEYFEILSVEPDSGLAANP
jgi:hypothetical protein